MDASTRVMAIRRTVVLFVILAVTLVALLMLEHGGSSAFSPTLIKGNTTSGVPSNGHHTGPTDHCNNGNGNDANANKHCISGGSS